MLKRGLINLISVLVYYSGLIALLRFVGRRYVKILLYHSVSNTETEFVKGTNAWVPTSRFVQQIDYLRRRYRVLSLEAAVKVLREGTVPERAVVITFDDGFGDTFRVAHPLLQRFRVPATVFLVTDSIGNKKPIWIQELSYLMNLFGPHQVAAVLASLTNDPAMAEAARASGKSVQRRLEKYLTYSVPNGRREAMLAELYGAFEVSREKVFGENRVYLDLAEIREMQRGGIAFGNHGKSHAALSTLSEEEQREEIADSRKILDEVLHLDFLPFAYPFGGDRDFTPATRALIEETGHSCTLTAMPSLNDARTSVHELGRIPVENVPLHRFVFELEKGVIKQALQRLKRFARLSTRREVGAPEPAESARQAERSRAASG